MILTLAATSQSAPPVLQADLDQGGLLAGSVVLTRDGALPVEYLEAGDAVITRSGMRRLQAVEVQPRVLAGVVHIAAQSLAPGRPEADVTLLAGQFLLLRNPQARSPGAPAHLLRVGDLVEHSDFRQDLLAQVSVYRLIFERPEVIYVAGLELACAGIGEA